MEDEADTQTTVSFCCGLLNRIVFIWRQHLIGIDLWACRKKKQPRLKDRKQQSVKKKTGRETPVPEDVEAEAETWRTDQDVHFQHLRSQNKTEKLVLLSKSAAMRELNLI